MGECVRQRTSRAEHGLVRYDITAELQRLATDSAAACGVRFWQISTDPLVLSRCRSASTSAISTVMTIGAAFSFCHCVQVPPSLHSSLPSLSPFGLLLPPISIGNESVPIQLVQCWFSGLAVSATFFVTARAR